MGILRVNKKPQPLALLPDYMASGGARKRKNLRVPGGRSRIDEQNWAQHRYIPLLCGVQYAVGLPHGYCSSRLEVRLIVRLRQCAYLTFACSDED
uniref:Uncharacterized protein n=1 Tax=Ascaris lumbricoides TaxID=6252 RepID=A0A9J2PUA7_ASCLU